MTYVKTQLSEDAKKRLEAIVVRIKALAKLPGMEKSTETTILNDPQLVRTFAALGIPSSTAIAVRNEAKALAGTIREHVIKLSGTTEMLDPAVVNYLHKEHRYYVVAGPDEANPSKMAVVFHTPIGDLELEGIAI